ncbi:hypothetical protein J6590_044500 [Homalodisca vitripennis]|nr:hypothetical protein J6590_044500 [Homalodisca vitripennis]
MISLPIAVDVCDRPTGFVSYSIHVTVRASDETFSDSVITIKLLIVVVRLLSVAYRLVNPQRFNTVAVNKQKSSTRIVGLRADITSASRVTLYQLLPSECTVGSLSTSPFFSSSPICRNKLPGTLLAELPDCLRQLRASELLQSGWRSHRPLFVLRESMDKPASWV